MMTRMISYNICDMLECMNLIYFILISNYNVLRFITNNGIFIMVQGYKYDTRVYFLKFKKTVPIFSAVNFHHTMTVFVFSLNFTNLLQYTCKNLYKYKRYYFFSKPLYNSYKWSTAFNI